jgi:antitoxin component YwqK of YwqJK toxin-antitoxin module
MSTLNELKECCKKYISDIQYVYKLCHNTCARRAWIVVMKKIFDTITNESRDGVINTRYAKFRANKLQVVTIISYHNPKRRSKKIIHKPDCMFPSTVYIKGHIVEPDKYDYDLNIICSNGIHYFNSIEAAYYYELMSYDYSGVWKTYRDNGEIFSYCTYKKGIKHGNYVSYYPSGNKNSEGSYVDDVKNGHWTHYLGGDVVDEGSYVDNKKHGRWIVHNMDKIILEQYDHGTLEYTYELSYSDKKIEK